MIDFHVHLGSLGRAASPRATLSPQQWVDRMDREGIELGVLLPLESPEVGGYFMTEEALAARDLYPERLIAFLCIDPRMPGLAAQFDAFVKRDGCCGFGEHLNGLPFGDPLNRAIYAKCDEYAFPLVFDLGCNNALPDDARLSGLESCLREFPNCTFVGHGPGWWAAISGDYDGTPSYPKGPIQPGGAVDRLMGEYDNMWADISAGSGSNAMTRDPEFTQGFVERHWRKLLFGSDICFPGQAIPQVQWLKALDVSEEVRDAIANGNARRLLGL